MSEKVSVIICTYNYARFLPQCLESVFSQTRPPDEVIVVDDGSTDATPEVVRKFEGVYYIRQEHAGKAPAFNRGFEASTGDIICHLDADDYWFPTKVKVGLSYFGAFPSVGGIIHNAAYIDARGNRLPEPTTGGQGTEPVLCSIDDLLFDSCVFHLKPRKSFGVSNTICVRRPTVEDFLPLPDEVGLAVDGFLMFAASKAGLLCIPEYLSVNRKHDRNYFADLSDHISMFGWLIGHPHFAGDLSVFQERLMRAKLHEYIAFLASSKGIQRLRGFRSAIQLLGYLYLLRLKPTMAHYLLPFACLAPGFLKGKRTAILQHLQRLREATQAGVNSE